MRSDNEKSSYKYTSHLSNIQKDFLEDQKRRIICKGNEIHITNHHLYSGFQILKLKFNTGRRNHRIKFFEIIVLAKHLDYNIKIPIKILTDKYLSAKYV